MFKNGVNGNATTFDDDIGYTVNNNSSHVVTTGNNISLLGVGLENN